ncbi:ferredoxin family protein [Xanthobacter dioxanivorans]|uniref:Ferredoxin family protein n=1 Tax=Xanthobacter dioxanivorans TaxID=2528964 RepID=A0A974PPQ9_9HYPH|nr:ferredoxin family protein [Xanthobacter dioxanivorans]QRG07201.1 ferredoxin family protein [Xanthobacter dioxanivorans]
MIELISAARCTGCNICVAACPTNVFASSLSGPPVIARQADCQTCFMCELYCPEDALYVAPTAGAPLGLASEADAPLPLGTYRAAIGWTPATAANRSVDAMHAVLSAK